MNDEHFSSEWIESQKALLLKYRVELLNKIKTSKQKSLDEEIDRSSEEGDMAQANQDQSVDFGLREKDILKLRSIDDALNRIHLGSYGYCLETDEPISKKRLEKIPWTRYTVYAQEQLEKELGSKHIA